ncbi:hypothetical protein K438DRAFT_1793652 [Mycena galopus ATCC 62051]|nr:hypothetical protein K438DRAFT_1793652 [Mycena galopus ATCC 62051]
MARGTGLRVKGYKMRHPENATKRCKTRSGMVPDGTADGLWGRSSGLIELRRRTCSQIARVQFRTNRMAPDERENAREDKNGLPSTLRLFPSFFALADVRLSFSWSCLRHCALGSPPSAHAIRLARSSLIAAAPLAVLSIPARELICAHSANFRDSKYGYRKIVSRRFDVILRRACALAGRQIFPSLHGR